ncbi:MAG: heterodisulfide reductase subunit C [Candidatus Bathyarchaeota archaeon B26-2]|nr:MAG: heterodisulfide reductase subunit C [Candidatus Bathyarchaeota archaeon B26-2]
MAKEGREARETLDVVKALRVDPNFKYEVMESPGGETLKVCFQCGTCTSSCPVARFTHSYRPRHLIRMAQLGLRNPVLSSDTLWLCAACFTCTDRCPQGVEVSSVLRVLRNLAVSKGFIPEAYKRMVETILSTGYAYRIPKIRFTKREALGLPPLPKGSVENLSKISKIMGFSEEE